MDYPEGKIRAAVQTILGLLVRKEYEALANLIASGSEQLRADDIRRTIESYPGKLRVPLEEELQFDVVEVEGRLPREFMVDASVFTIEEGRSDLTARLTIIDNPSEGYEIVFYDVWVM